MFAALITPAVRREQRCRCALLTLSLLALPVQELTDKVNELDAELTALGAAHRAAEAAATQGKQEAEALRGELQVGWSTVRGPTWAHWALPH